MSKTLSAYVFFLILISVFSYLFVDYNLSYLKLIYTGFYTAHRFITGSLFAVIILVFFTFYSVFLRQIRRGTFNLKLIILITSVILFFSYPAILSYDIFNYVTTSKVLFGYHENPYILTPSQFSGDPLLQFTRATNKVALYGPFWLLVSGIPYVLSFGNFFITLFGFKAIAAGFYLATTYLIFKVTKSEFSTAAFALNPLVIIESLVSAHNDIFMMFLALFSFYFLSKREKVRGIIYLFLSILVKYATSFLLPVFIYDFWKMLKGRSINFGKTYLVAFISMLIIFALSPLREEAYPWYGIWFITFASIVPGRSLLLYLSFGLSFGLLLSYLPFMFSGNYFGTTPFLKTILMLMPTALFLLLGFRRKLWIRRFFWQ